MLRSVTLDLSQGIDTILLATADKLFSHLLYIDSNSHRETQKCFFDKVLAIGCREEISITDASSALDELHDFTTSGEWIAGYLSYDLKNAIEPVCTTDTQVPLAHLFKPLFVLTEAAGIVTAHFDDTVLDEEKIKNHISVLQEKLPQSETALQANIRAHSTREEYLKNCESLLANIKRGNIYEVNYCIAFSAEEVQIEPAEVFYKLNTLSAAPFASLMKVGSQYVISASPERFLQKRAKRLISQPMKGTRPRAEENQTDKLLFQELQSDAKERAENIMITDLVRNDLSRLATRSSVRVDELCGVYSFRQVHQMISTVSCELRDDQNFAGIIRATFPMGSMTGAPKVSAMKLISSHESGSRGIYSGTVGFITPEGDFDFSVIIRSIIYNSNERKLSFHAGSALTADAIPEKEYEECLLKATAMAKALGANIKYL